MNKVKLILTVALAAVLASIAFTPASADDAKLSDLQASLRHFTGSPSAVLVDESTTAMNVVTQYRDVFSGGAFAADYRYLEIFHVAGTEAKARELLTAAKVDPATYRLTAVQHSASDYAREIEAIIRTANNAEIQWSTITPNFLIDGVDLGIPTAPSQARVQEIFELLGPLGMARLGVVPQATAYTGSGDVYTTPGMQFLNGRLWSTTCEAYSVGQRCWTNIWATTVAQVNGKFIQRNGWAFNSLTYEGIPRPTWGSNPLANTGTWTAADGREWRTECGTAVSGGNGCRSWVKASYITSNLVGGQRTFSWTRGWVVNNLVRFGAVQPSGPTEGPVLYDN